MSRQRPPRRAGGVPVRGMHCWQRLGAGLGGCLPVPGGRERVAVPGGRLPGSGLPHRGAAPRPGLPQARRAPGAGGASGCPSLPGGSVRCAPGSAGTAASSSRSAAEASAATSALFAPHARRLGAANGHRQAADPRHGFEMRMAPCPSGGRALRALAAAGALARLLAQTWRACFRTQPERGAPPMPRPPSPARRPPPSQLPGTAR